MSDKQPKYLSPKLSELLLNFSPETTGQDNLKQDNDTKVGTAVVYEKIRSSLEYQEEHLLLKNAIFRILWRRITLAPQLDAKKFKSDLISELSWANYLNPELVTDELSDQIVEKIERYLILYKYGQSGHFKKRELTKMVIGWLACDLDVLLCKKTNNDVFLDYVADILEKNIELKDSRLTEEESRLQLKIATNLLVLKPDYATLQYWILKNIYKDWDVLPLEEVKKIARSFDPYYNKIDRALNHRFKREYHQYVKRNIPPFILLYSILLDKKLNVDEIRNKPYILQNLIMDKYEQMVAAARKKVWRGSMRALIFVLITKVSLAFMLEIPFDRYFFGSIDYLALIINVLTPPLLMLVAGTFIKSPPKKNHTILAESAASIIMDDKFEDKPYRIGKQKKSSNNSIFNIAYLIFSCLILYGVIRLLLLIGYNILGILLFFFFVSVVSFFSFRIRNIALELAMRRTRDDAITSTVELFFLPFIRIGKFFSDKVASFNPFMIALDFLIEAPLKTIIKIFNSWFRYINNKKEELEY